MEHARARFGMSGERQGPLRDLHVVELAGMGAAPFAAMLLADLGADVIRIDRPLPAAPAFVEETLARGRPSVSLDLKRDGAAEVVLRLVARADALVEGFRPGVMERLGLGPEPCLARNPRLVYGRMTGWGQTGPLAELPGHDINYIALSGALASIGRPGALPVPPLNLVGDFGGGGLLLAFGIVSAVLEARSSGRGQVVDAAMTDGSALLTTMIHGLRNAGLWSSDRGGNLLDGGAPFYDTYATADGKCVAVGCLEPKFFAEFAQRIGLDESFVPRQYDRRAWPEMRAAIAARLATRTRDDWGHALDGSDACVAPVLTLREAPMHPHARERGAFIEVDGVLQAGPAPRFSRTGVDTPRPPRPAGFDGEAVLLEAGFSRGEVDALRASGALRLPAQGVS
jgi:alpha-methylacyl-CoA racemase